MLKELTLFCSIAFADYSTSNEIIKRGGYELNPLLRGSESKQILFHSSKCVAQSFIVSKTNKKKQRLVRSIGVAISLGFVTHNLIQMNKK